MISKSLIKLVKHSISFIQQTNGVLNKVIVKIFVEVEQHDHVGVSEVDFTAKYPQSQVSFHRIIIHISCFNENVFLPPNRVIQQTPLRFINISLNSFDLFFRVKRRIPQNIWQNIYVQKGNIIWWIRIFRCVLLLAKFYFTGVTLRID